jgi:hypothetical protein
MSFQRNALLGSASAFCVRFQKEKGRQSSFRKNKYVCPKSMVLGVEEEFSVLAGSSKESSSSGTVKDPVSPTSASKEVFTSDFVYEGEDLGFSGTNTDNGN